MRHNLIKADNSGDHWAVNSATLFLPGGAAVVLVQLQGGGEQVRVPLTPEQAEDMAAELRGHAAKARAAQPSVLSLSEIEIQLLPPVAQENYRRAFQIQEEARAAAVGSPSHG